MSIQSLKSKAMTLGLLEQDLVITDEHLPQQVYLMIPTASCSFSSTIRVY